MKNNDLPYIKKLLSDDYHDETCQSYEMFEYLAQEQNFTFEFIQLPTINEGYNIFSFFFKFQFILFSLSLSKGSIQLLLEVRVNPVSVFHGYGETFDLARQNSANLALKYIRCLSKQQQHSSSIIATTPIMQSTA
jgi:hypothetical protein